MIFNCFQNLSSKVQKTFPLQYLYSVDLQTNMKFLMKNLFFFLPSLPLGDVIRNFEWDEKGWTNFRRNFKPFYCWRKYLLKHYEHEIQWRNENIIFEAIKNNMFSSRLKPNYKFFNFIILLLPSVGVSCSAPRKHLQINISLNTYTIRHIIYVCI